MPKVIPGSVCLCGYKCVSVSVKTDSGVDVEEKSWA